MNPEPLAAPHQAKEGDDSAAITIGRLPALMIAQQEAKEGDDSAGGQAVEFEGAVLAGGASRRMGTDKAFISIGNTTLIEKAVDALYAAGAYAVSIIGGDAKQVRNLGLTYVDDLWPRQGPLGGIITALNMASANAVGILSCDLVQPSSAEIIAARRRLGDADVCVPLADGQEQWLHAIWKPSCKELLQDAFNEGLRALKHAIGKLEVAYYVASDPQKFVDADTLADLPPATNLPTTTGQPPTANLPTTTGQPTKPNLTAKPNPPTKSSDLPTKPHLPRSEQQNPTTKGQP